MQPPINHRGGCGRESNNELRKGTDSWFGEGSEALDLGKGRIFGLGEGTGFWFVERADFC